VRGLALLIGTPCQFLQLELLDFCKAVLCPSSGKAAKASIFLAPHSMEFSMFDLVVVALFLPESQVLVQIICK
jgi:hypothetical protein